MPSGRTARRTPSARPARWRCRRAAARSPTCRSAAGCRTSALLPYTINTAIAPIPLPRETAEAEARILVDELPLHVAPDASRVAERPVSPLRLRQPDTALPRGPVRAARRQRRDVGDRWQRAVRIHPALRRSRRVVHTVVAFVAFRVGYGREHDDRTFRFVEATTEHIVRASIDSAGVRLGIGAAAVRPCGADRRRPRRGGASAISVSRSRCGSSTSRTARAIASARSCRWCRVEHGWLQRVGRGRTGEPPGCGVRPAGQRSDIIHDWR